MDLVLTRGREGVQNLENLADVICASPLMADTKFLAPSNDRFNGLQTVFAELQKMLSIMNRGRVFIYDRERGNSGMILRQNARSKI